MATKVVLKRSSVAGKVPTTSDIAVGEFAWNSADGKLYGRDDTGIVEITGQTSNSWNLQVYVDGTDFTAGTTTSLTLPAEPASSEADLFVFFDGVFQNSTQWSYSGTTLTFSSAIPDGVENVEVRVWG